MFSLIRCTCILTCVGFLLFSSTNEGRADSRPDWITNQTYKSVIPDAIYAGPLNGEPPVAPVYGAGAIIIGYVFETSAIVDKVGFSGASFKIIAGIDINGVITGVSLLEHSEPILDYGDRTSQLDRFTGQYTDIDYATSARISGGNLPGDIDGISAATISARSFNQAIIQSARTVAQSLGFSTAIRDSATVDTLQFETLGWTELISSGAIQRTEIHHLEGDNTSRRETNKDISEVYVALVSPVSIGRNLVSRGLYKNFVSPQNPQDLIFLVMSTGPFSFVGTSVFSTGTFDRIHVVQHDQQYTLIREKNRYRYVPFLTVEGAPEFSEMGIFRVPASTGVDVLSPWDVTLSIREGNDGAVVRESVISYQLPQRFILPATPLRISAPEKSPMQTAWQAQLPSLVILITALSILTMMIAWMERLTRRRGIYRIARHAFLLFTLIWLGWIAGVQLSVINPIAWVQSLSTGNGLNMLLLDPLLAVLTAYVLISFIAWGRGIFCGWLCPFGALQELLAGLARYAKVPQISLSYETHRKLWPVKYVILMGVVLAALHEPETFGLVAEIEPFKTAISLKFDRHWPFVVYALGLLATALFIERAFCRFLCPLGAIMALGGRLRMGNPLQRRNECGSPCQLCARRCPVQAITPTGRIEMNECFYCLDCQVIYNDEHQCPPLNYRHKRQREAATTITAPIRFRS